MNSPTATARDRWTPALWGCLTAGAALVAVLLGGGLAATTLPILVGATITRAGMDAAGVGCVGLALLGVFLPGGASAASAREIARVQSTADRALVAVAGGWLVLVLLGLTFRAAEAYGRTVSGLGTAEVGRFATEVAAGRGMILTAGCAAVVLGCGIARLRDPDRVQVRVPLIAALLGVLTPAVTGHAGSAPDHQLAVITVALHVGAAALWVGGLGALLVLLARHRTLLDATVGRYSWLAGVCVVTVGLTGMVNAAVRIESFGALYTTGYGLLVVAKSVLLVVLAGLGGLARRRLAAGRVPALRWAGCEVALMAVTMGVAAALTQTA